MVFFSVYKTLLMLVFFSSSALNLVFNSAVFYFKRSIIHMYIYNACFLAQFTTHTHTHILSMIKPLTTNIISFVNSTNMLLCFFFRFVLRRWLLLCGFSLVLVLFPIETADVVCSEMRTLCLWKAMKCLWLHVRPSSLWFISQVFLALFLFLNISQNTLTNKIKQPQHTSKRWQKTQNKTNSNNNKSPMNTTYDNAPQ